MDCIPQIRTRISLPSPKLLLSRYLITDYEEWHIHKTGAEQWGYRHHAPLETVHVDVEAWNYRPEMLYSCTWSSVGHSSECLEDQDVHRNSDSGGCAHKDSKGVKRTQQALERGHLCYVLANEQT